MLDIKKGFPILVALAIATVSTGCITIQNPTPSPIVKTEYQTVSVPQTIYQTSTIVSTTPIYTTATYTTTYATTAYATPTSTTPIYTSTTPTPTYSTPTYTTPTPTPSTSLSWQALQAKKIAAAMDITNPITRDYAVQLAAQYPGSYNIDQVCAIWDYVHSKWRYVNDPGGNDYYATASESIKNNLAGDCDDFAIEIASLIEAIGGGARVISAYNTTSSSHAYPEVYIGPKNAALTKQVIQDLANKYNSVIWYEIDSNDGVWLNLDWSDGHIGGPFFVAQQYVSVRSNGYWETFIPSMTFTRPSIIKHTQIVANSTTNTPAGSYNWWDFTVVSGATLTGTFAANGGTGNDISAYILDDASFANFKAGKSVSTLYNSGQVSQGNFHVTFTTAGNFHLVLDNRFSTISSKNVTAYAVLEWETPA